MDTSLDEQQAMSINMIRILRGACLFVGALLSSSQKHHVHQAFARPRVLAFDVSSSKDRLVLHLLLEGMLVLEPVAM